MAHKDLKLILPLLIQLAKVILRELLLGKISFGSNTSFVVAVIVKRNSIIKK